MAEPLRHRQTKGAETDMFSLQPPRHISTLPPPPGRSSGNNATVSCAVRWHERVERTFGPLTADSDKGPSDSSGRDQRI